MPTRDLRRRRQWVRGLIALGLLVLVGVVVAFQAAVHWIVERELTRTFDAWVRIDRLRVSPLTGGLTATGLRISEKASRQPLLRIQKVEIRILPGALWHREILVTHLKLEQPEAWLALTPEGISWMSFGMPSDGSPSRLAVSLGDVEVREGRVRVADRRGATEQREVVEAITVTLRDLSTRDDRREVPPAVSLSGRWRGMTVSGEGWVAPFAHRRAFHLPLQIREADLGRVAGILPPGLTPPGLAGKAKVSVDIRGQEVSGEWQVQAGVRVEARRVMARPRPDLAVQGRSLRLEGEGHWNPRVIGFSRLELDLAGATIEMGDRLRASVDRLGLRGQADLDHRGLLVPEMVVEAAGISLGRAGHPPAVEVGRISAAGGVDQRAGTARLEQVSLADVSIQALRRSDGSLDVAEWIGGPAQAEAEMAASHPLSYWEILQLDVERARLDFTDRADGPERTLAVRNAGLRLRGATSDPAQPITFDLTASTSVAPGIALHGTWMRAAAQVAARLAVRQADLSALRAWLPATLQAGVPSGRASLAVEADVRSGPDGLAASGAGTFTLHNVQLVAERMGSLAAEDLEIGLTRFQAAGPGRAGLTLEAEGQVRGKTVEARIGERTDPMGGGAAAAEIQVTLGRLGFAPREGGSAALTVQGRGAIRGLHAEARGYGLDSLAARAAELDVSGLAIGLGPEGSRMEVAGRLSLTQAEGRMPAMPVRTWRAAGIRVDLGQLQTAPLRVHVRELELDQPQIQAVRAGDGLAATADGPDVSTPPSIRLDRLVVRNGRVGFRDETVRPAWATEMTQVDALIEDLQIDRDTPAAFRLSAREIEGARVRLHGRVRPVTWSGELHADVENLDVLRPGPYLPDVVHRVVRGGTLSGGMDLSLQRTGQVFHVTGKGEVTLAPLELGDARRQLTLVLANKVLAQVDRLTLNPLAIRLSTLRLEDPWIAVGRDEEGVLPALRLADELRRTTGNGPGHAATGASITVGRLTITDGLAEIEDRAVQPRFRDQVRNLAVSIADLSTEGNRKASVAVAGELSDRSTLALKGFVLPLPSNLYVDLEGEVHDFNLHRLNPYTTRVTSHRLERGKLFTQVRYRIERDRLEGENLIQIDQLALGDQVEPADRFEALVGVPFAVAISLLQNADGEIFLRVPVRGRLDRPEFDLADVMATAVKNTVMQLIAAPFQVIGEIFTLGGKIGAIEIAPVLFAPGSWALDEAAREHLREIAAVMRARPRMKVKLAGMAHFESDDEGLRAQKLEAELRRIAREPGVKGRDDALDRLALRSFGAATTGLSREAKFARLKAAQTVAARDVEDLPDMRILSIYDYMAGVEKLERNRMFLAEGKIYRTAEGGGDWARRADFTILKP